MDKLPQFVVITTSRKRDEILFMVDRAKQRASFWSNRIDDAFCFGSKSAAEAKAASLRFNRPRVMPLADARQLSLAQGNERELEAAMSAGEDGWDGHKGHF